MQVNVQGPNFAGANPQLVADLVIANRILFTEQVVDAFGHVSVRHDQNQGYFLLSRSLAPALVTREDILCFDLKGDVQNGMGAAVYVERFIHSEIYARYPSVNAVVHSHSPAIIPFCSAKVPLRPLFHMSSFLGNGAPVFEIRETAGDRTDMLIRTRELGSALAAKLAGSSVILMRGHGNVVVGQSIRQAVFRSIYAQLNARLQIDALGLGRGEITYLNEFEAATADATNNGALALDRAWELWSARALGSNDAP
jgi:HCOMODA/2-hydroxy-3-carboxy-muconic semialdehyde decarboxylase